MENLELPRLLLVFFCFFKYLPYRSECVGKPCEMVTWPNVCYDVILKVNPILNLVMNCTLIV